MSAGIGGSKGSSDTTNQSTSAGVQSGTGSQSNSNAFTPNNLPFLRQGWDAASGFLYPQASSTLVGNGIFGSQSATGEAQQVANAGANSGLDFARGSFVDNPSNAYLTPFARGDFVNSNNPQFQSVIKNISNVLQPQIDGSFGAAGRYGSGANANAFADALTKTTGDLAYQNYTQQQQNQLAAAQQIGNNYTTGRQQQLSGVGLIPGLTTNMLTPSSAAVSTGLSPFLAYMRAIAASNGGGVSNGTANTNYNTNSTTNNAGTSNTDTSKFGWGISAGAGGGK